MDGGGRQLEPSPASTLLTLALIGVAGVLLGGNLLSARRMRRRLSAELEHHRERAARLDGELAAARALQMGLLPHRYPAFPDQPEIDIFARIEPARTVGGDLFDYLLVAPGLLFFVIGDVSGKGIPAALFMAMTKEVLRDAARRHGTALDRILAEANEKTAAAAAEMPWGGDMMFVAAFAGILDLASGALEFASAGHDAPYVLSRNAEPRLLATAGGPPLGAADGFVFPVDHDCLAEDEILLLYTDGITEAADRSGMLYSAARLATTLAALPMRNARTVVDAAFSDVRRFVADAEPADDITLLALRRVPPPLGGPRRDVIATPSPACGAAAGRS